MSVTNPRNTCETHKKCIWETRERETDLQDERQSGGYTDTRMRYTVSAYGENGRHVFKTRDKDTW